MDGGIVHLVAGAFGGTVGAVVTCPLEVVKTRLQSSNLSSLSNRSLLLDATLFNHNYEFAISNKQKSQLRLFTSLKNIIFSEGISGLFKGLGPNIIGVAPSRAIYFGAYAKSKSFLNNLDLIPSDTPIVHFFSASVAGFTSSTATNPIWVVKTRLQLNTHSGLSMWQCSTDILTKEGWRGFYKGLTASYYGISETIIHLVIYEQIKQFLNSNRLQNSKDEDCTYTQVRSFIHQFCDYMLAGAISKTIATTIAYPHEVARTRLREEGSKYKGFWKTLDNVIKEDGFRGIYRGLVTQLIRQIPNTALTMATYEAVVYLAEEYYKT